MRLFRRSARSPSHVLHPRWRSIEEILEAHPVLRLDLGCGYVKPDGFVGLDDLSGKLAQVADEANAPDVYLDLNAARYPFPDGSCTEIRGSHFLEHSNLPHVFEEVHRLLRAGGTFLFVVPYANSAEGMYPGHQIFLTERFFHENLMFQELFEIVREEFFPTELYEQLPEALREELPFDLARRVLFNVCHQMLVEARPRK